MFHLTCVILKNSNKLLIRESLSTLVDWKVLQTQVKKCKNISNGNRNGAQVLVDAFSIFFNLFPGYLDFFFLMCFCSVLKTVCN